PHKQPFQRPSVMCAGPLPGSGAHPEARRRPVSRSGVGRPSIGMKRGGVPMQTAAAQLPSQKGGGTGPRPGNGRVGQDLALDGGSIFFAQRRVGLRGQTFRMLKFRSMVVHAERLRPRLEVRNESNGPVFKMKLDPRVTPIGRFIRKYSFDELPQIINVLLGDM